MYKKATTGEVMSAYFGDCAAVARCLLKAALQGGESKPRLMESAAFYSTRALQGLKVLQARNVDFDNLMDKLPRHGQA